MLLKLNYHDAVPPNYTGLIQRPFSNSNSLRSKEHWFNGKLHRLDWNARYWEDGEKDYAIFNYLINERSVLLIIIQVTNELNK